MYKSIKVCDTCYDQIKEPLKQLSLLDEEGGPKKQEPTSDQEEETPVTSPEQDKGKEGLMMFSRVKAGQEISEKRDSKMVSLNPSSDYKEDKP